MSCKCQQCGKQYRVDFIIPDYVWEKIKPVGKAYGAGLLCGSCIFDKIEDFGVYGGICVDRSGDAFNVPI